MKICKYCTNEVSENSNWDCCDACVVKMHEDAGYTRQCPNGLEPRCFTVYGAMLECEHGDHPDYLFPIEVEYVGEREPDCCEFDYLNEQHALVYANGSIAVTMYETCSSAWMISPFRGTKGLCLGGHLHKANEWKLTDESLEKINAYVKKKYDKPGVMTFEEMLKMKSGMSRTLSHVIACNPIVQNNCEPISDEILEKVWSNSDTCD